MNGRVAGLLTLSLFFWFSTTEAQLTTGTITGASNDQIARMGETSGLRVNLIPNGNTNPVEGATAGCTIGSGSTAAGRQLKFKYPVPPRERADWELTRAKTSEQKAFRQTAGEVVSGPSYPHGRDPLKKSSSPFFLLARKPRQGERLP